MIKSVVFDIGNVLADFSWKEMYEAKGLSGEVLDRVAKATVLSPYWKEIDRGIMTYEEILDQFVGLDSEMESQIRQVLENTHGIVKKREYAISWIRYLKEIGLQVYVLSNFGEKVLEDCADALDFLPYTDGGIISYREHLIKPQPEIYQLLLRRYGLNAKECVFIDDLKENIEGAKKQGMYGIVFETYEQAIEQLNTLIENEKATV